MLALSTAASWCTYTCFSHVITGDFTSEPPHQHPALHEELSGQQQQQHIKKTQWARLRLRTPHRGNFSRVIISVLQDNFVRNLKKHLCVCVCSPCWTCVSLAYQTWESSSWMSWWTVCYHIWVRSRQRSHWVDRRPGGPRISPHTPFSTISMVGMLPCTLYSLNRCSCSCYGIVDFLFPVNEST